MDARTVTKLGVAAAALALSAHAPQAKPTAAERALAPLVGLLSAGGELRFELPTRHGARAATRVEWEGLDARAFNGEVLLRLTDVHFEQEAGGARAKCAGSAESMLLRWPLDGPPPKELPLTLQRFDVHVEDEQPGSGAGRTSLHGDSATIHVPLPQAWLEQPR